MSVTGEPQGLPQKVGATIIDAATVQVAAQAILAAEIYLAWTYRAAFAPMLHLRTPLSQASHEAGEPARAHLAA